MDSPQCHGNAITRISVLENVSFSRRFHLLNALHGAEKILCLCMAQKKLSRWAEGAYIVDPY